MALIILLVRWCTNYILVNVCSATVRFLHFWAVYQNSVRQASYIGLFAPKNVGVLLIECRYARI